MTITTAYLHIMDKDSGNLVLTAQPIDPANQEAMTYVTKALQHFLAGEYTAVDPQTATKLTAMTQADDVLAFSKNVATAFYNSIAPETKIPGGDLLCISYTDEEGQPATACLKLDFKSGYIHSIDYQGKDVQNSIVHNAAILMQPTSSVADGFILTQNQLLLRQKTYRGNDGPWTLGQNVLGIEKAVRKSTDVVKTIQKTVAKVADTYDEDPVEVQSQMQQAMTESLDASSEIDQQKVLDRVFKTNSPAKAQAKADLEDQGITAPEPVANPIPVAKKLAKQRVKLDNGIEITIPVKLLSDRDIIEFSTNQDGTTSVTIHDTAAVAQESAQDDRAAITHPDTVAPHVSSNDADDSDDDVPF